MDCTKKVRFSCEYCEKSYCTPRQVRDHASKIHGKVGFSCEYCEKSFSSSSRVRDHASKIHGIDASDDKHKHIACPHPECKFLFRSRNLLREHIIDVHKVPLEVEQKSFETFKDFELWKENIEREMKCFYVKNQSFHLSSIKDYKNFYFLCNRSGFFSSVGTGKRNITKCSNKIDGYCPSSMEVLVSTENGEVEVAFWKTHYGHNNLELRRLPLSKTDKKAIVEKIMSGQTFTQILNEVRNSGSGADLERINLITRKDLHNIVQQFNLKAFVKLDEPRAKKNQGSKVLPGSKRKLNAIVKDIVVSDDEDSLNASMPEDSLPHSPPPSLVNNEALKEKLELIKEMLDSKLKEEEIVCIDKTFDNIIDYLNENRKELCSLEQKIELSPENCENFSQEGCYFINTAEQNKTLQKQNVSNRDIVFNIAENNKQVCSLEQKIESRYNSSINILSQAACYVIKTVEQNKTPPKQNVPQTYTLVKICRPSK